MKPACGESSQKVDPVGDKPPSLAWSAQCGAHAGWPSTDGKPCCYVLCILQAMTYVYLRSTGCKCKSNAVCQMAGLSLQPTVLLPASHKPDSTRDLTGRRGWLPALCNALQYTPTESHADLASRSGAHLQIEAFSSSLQGDQNDLSLTVSTVRACHIFILPKKA